MSKLNAVLNEFLKDYPVRSFSSGRTIVYQGEVPRSSYLIMKGMVRIFSVDKRGDESNISFISAGNIFPIEVIFEKTSSSLHFYEASMDSEIAVIPTGELMKSVSKDLELSKIIHDEIATQYVGAKLHIEALEQTRAQEKILRILHYLVLRFGQSKGDGKWRIELRLKQHDIANMIGVTRETTATELGKLKKANVIEYDSFHYTIDMDALMKMTGSEEWNDLDIEK